MNGEQQGDAQSDGCWLPGGSDSRPQIATPHKGGRGLTTACVGGISSLASASVARQPAVLCIRV